MKEINIFSFINLIKLVYKYMTFLQKISFCNTIRNNSEFFSAFRGKNRVIEVISFIYFFVFLQVTNCTTIGFHNREELKNYSFSDEITYKFCILKEESISDSRINSLVEDLANELKIYNIKLEAKVLANYTRPAFTTKNIYHAISSLSLPENCDRLMVLLKRNVFDFLVHIILPEVMGLVEGDTRTRGYIYADYFSINILAGGTPSNILIHENYHFLGCNHHILMNNCYKSISEHRSAASHNYKNKIDFFPSLWQDFVFIKNREQVNSYIKKQSK